MTMIWKSIDTSDMRFYSGNGTFALYAVQNNEVVAVVPLYDWRDFNTSGDVGWKEWMKSKLPLVSHLETGMLASIFLRIKETEPNIMAGADAGVQGGAKLVDMGFAMIEEGIKEAYVKPLVAVAGGKWGLNSNY